MGRKVLLHAPLPGPEQVTAQNRGRVLPFLIQNDTNLDLSNVAGTPVTTIEQIPSEAVEIPLLNMLSIIKNFTTEFQVKTIHKLHTAVSFSKKQQENPKVTRRKNNLIKKKKGRI